MVFIAILEGTVPEPEDLTGLRDAMQEIDSGRAILVTSVVVHAEVIAQGNDPDVREKLRRLLTRSNAIVQGLNEEITIRTGDIREAVLSLGRTLKTPDATFIAVALAHGCDALHTFDDKLLKLSGLDEVDGLRITRPSSEQTTMRLDDDAE